MFDAVRTALDRGRPRSEVGEEPEIAKRATALPERECLEVKEERRRAGDEMAASEGRSREAEREGEPIGERAAEIEHASRADARRGRSIGRVVDLRQIVRISLDAAERHASDR